MYALAASDLYELGGEDLVDDRDQRRGAGTGRVFDVLDELERQPGILRLSPETRAAAATLVDGPPAATSSSPTSGRPARCCTRSCAARAGSSGSPRRDRRPREEALSNIARFFDIIRAQSALLADDRAVFVARHLQTLIQAGDDPPTADIDPDADAVAVMTVHKAKGLEFPVVYLPGLVITGRFPAIGRREPLALPLELVNETLPEGDYQLQEERRLFYVGMTRARDELVLSHAADYGGPAGAAGVAVRARGARPAGRGRDRREPARRRPRRSSGWPALERTEPVAGAAPVAATTSRCGCRSTRSTTT